jgi:hypothetical protein
MMQCSRIQLVNWPSSGRGWASCQCPPLPPSSFRICKMQGPGWSTPSPRRATSRWPWFNNWSPADCLPSAGIHCQTVPVLCRPCKLPQNPQPMTPQGKWSTSRRRAGRTKGARWRSWRLPIVRLGCHWDHLNRIMFKKIKSRTYLRMHPSAARPSRSSKTRCFPSPPHDGFGFIKV